MRKSVKSIISSLLVLVMVLSSFTVFSISGSAAAGEKNNNKGNPVSGASTKVETVQFYSSFTPGAGVTDEVELKDLVLTDTAFRPAGE